jgi:lysosomal Pro-X carboxypeptidase
MLAAWLRQKYPQKFYAAFASSAPVFQFNVNCLSFYKVTTNSFKQTDPVCAELILASWQAINNLSKTRFGIEQLRSIFHLCEDISHIGLFKSWLKEIYVNSAQINYPQASFSDNPLPARPVKVLCSNITSHFENNNFDADDVSLLKAIYSGINVYLNYTGSEKCFDLYTEGTSDDLVDLAWSYQVFF